MKLAKLHILNLNAIRKEVGRIVSRLYRRGGGNLNSGPSLGFVLAEPPFTLDNLTRLHQTHVCNLIWQVGPAGKLAPPGILRQTDVATHQQGFRRGSTEYAHRNTGCVYTV